MQPAVSVQDVPRVSPAWLRPSAFGLVLCLHLLVLVGLPWPVGTSRIEPPPLEIQVISPPQPAQLLVPIDSAAAVELKPTTAAPVDVPAVEAQPLHGREAAEIKPPDPTLAIGSLKGLAAAPAPESEEPLTAAQPPAAPVEVAEPAPAAERPEGSAPPVDPPRQVPLPSSEQHVAELEPLVARPEAAAQATQPTQAPEAEASIPALDPPSQSLSPEQHVAESAPLAVRPEAAGQATQPARQSPSAEASAPALDPPSQSLSPEQHVAELEPLVARPEAAAQATQPVLPAPSAEASVPALDPPSQSLSPEHHVAELEPLQARPAAPVEAVQPARDPPPAEVPASAIAPPNRPLPSEQRVAESEAPEVRPPTAQAEVAQPAPEVLPAAPPASAIDPQRQPPPGPQVAELMPLGAPQAAAPVPVGPPAHEVPMAESSTASNAPAPGMVSSSEKQVAKAEPYSPGAVPLQEEGQIMAGRIGQIVHYVEQYDGGGCFFVAPVRVTETEAKLEGYGASARPFEALDSAFRHENGFEASIDVRLVNPAQCPSVTFLGRLRGTNAPHLHIDGVNLGPGAVLTGSVDGFGGRNVELLIATDAGTLQNVSHLLKPGADAKTFTIGRSDIAWASGGQPQLLIAVATPLPLKALRFDRPVAAERVFPAALGEAERANQPIAAMARYFKLEP